MSAEQDPNVLEEQRLAEEEKNNRIRAAMMKNNPREKEELNEEETPSKPIFPPRGFIMSNEQAEWVDKEKETIKRIIASEPKVGLFRLVARQEMLYILTDLHNMEHERRKKQ